MNVKRLCAVAAALALGLAACGDDDDDESATTGTSGTTAEEQPAPTEPAGETVTLSETEFAIDPAAVSVDQAGVVEFKVENAGSITHALEVEGAGLEEETEDIAAGDSASLKVDLPEGTYKLYCPIGNHEDQGMVAQLTVGAGDASSGEDDSGGGDEPRDDNSGGAEAPDDNDDNSGGAEAPPSGY
jgi:uncharacterized cupredoxin-like copper-binding protein